MKTKISKERQSAINRCLRVIRDSIALELKVRIHFLLGNVDSNFDQGGRFLFFSIKNKTLRVVLKTEPEVSSTGNMYFPISKTDFKRNHFIVTYLHEKKDYFIVPIKKLEKGENNGKEIYKLNVQIDKNGNYTDELKLYQNNWELIKEKAITM